MWCVEEIEVSVLYSLANAENVTGQWNKVNDTKREKVKILIYFRIGGTCLQKNPHPIRLGFSSGSLPT